MRGTHGFALAIVLWCVGILAVALVTAAAFIDASLSAQALSTQATIARQLALSGITFATGAKTEKFPVTFTRKVEQEGEFTVVKCSDSGRVNLNTLLKKKDTEAISRLLIALGGDPQKIEMAAAALKRTSWFSDEADSATFIPIESSAQLLAIPEVAAAMSKSTDWRSSLTLWGNALIDLNYAEAPVLTALGGLSKQQASMLVRARLGQDGVAGTKDDLKLTSLEQVTALVGLPPDTAAQLGKYFGVATELQRIEASATVGRVKRHISVIVQPGEQTFKPVAWDET